MRGYHTAHRSDDGWSQQGGYERAKKSKLELQFASKVPPVSRLFHGISIYVNGYTNPPASKLRTLVSAHGGRYCAYYRRSTVTHVIASRLTTSKMNRLTDDRIVSANWIVESIEANRLLPWQNYQLSHSHMNGKQHRLEVIQAPVESTSSESVASKSFNQHIRPADASHNGDACLFVAHQDDSKISASNQMKQVQLDSYISPVKSSDARASLPTHRPNGTISFNQLLGGDTWNSLSATTTPRLHSSDQSDDLYRQSSTPKSTAALQQTSSADSLLATFYSRSRLHHLSSWTNDLRALVRRLREDSDFAAACREGDTWKQHILEADESSSFVTIEARPTCSMPQQLEPPPSQARILLHIDLDCFFVSVAVRGKPELKDKPIAITHATGPVTDVKSRQRGFHSMSEIASCSYAARKAGVHNGMLLGEARQICPDLITLPYDFEACKEVSEQLYRTVAQYTLDIKAASCDELYADCTELLTVSVNRIACTQQECVRQHLINPLLFGQHLRDQVALRTRGCTASVGFGTSLLLARLATKKAKPNGQAWFLGCSANRNSTGYSFWRWCPTDTLKCGGADSVSDSELSGSDADWLRGLSLQELPGVGQVLANRLISTFNARTCGDLIQAASLAQLKNLLGPKTGERLYWLCRGRDPTETLHVEPERKSVSACINYGLRLHTNTELDQLVQSLTQELVSRMSNVQLTRNNPTGIKGVVANSLTVHVLVRSPDAPRESKKYMGHGVCDRSSRTHTFSEPTADVAIIHQATLSILRRLCPDVCELRGLGLQVNRLSPRNSTKRIPKQNIRQCCVTTQNIAPIPKITPNGSFSADDRVSECGLSIERPSPFVPCLTPMHILVPKRRRPLRLTRSHISQTDSDNVSSVLEMGVTHGLKAGDSTAARSSHSTDTSNRDRCDSINVQLVSDTAQGCTSLYTHATNHEHSSGQIQYTACSLQSYRENSSVHIHSTEQHQIHARLSVSDLESATGNRWIDHIRQKLANSIVTETRPLLKDMCALASCLVSLVPYDLEGVRTCVICLNRVIDQLCQPNSLGEHWRKAMARVRATVEYSVEQYYNASLLP